MKNLRRTRKSSRIQCLHELRTWAAENKLPEKYEDVQPFTTYAIPMDDTEYPDVLGVALTMKCQIDWIGQLVQKPLRFVIHGDGKWKLHHGNWILITFGTHSNEFDKKKGKIVHSFRPLVYLFTRNQESKSCVRYALNAMNSVALKFFGSTLHPGATCSDHGSGIMSGLKNVFPDADLMGCWPHIAWGLGYGKVLKPGNHPDLEMVKAQFAILHLCPSRGAWDVFLQAVGAIWGDQNAGLNKLWSERMRGRKANWYIGFSDCPQSVPSQQGQECWHRFNLMVLLVGQLRVSTAQVLSETLPRAMRSDGESTCSHSADSRG